MYEKNIPYKVGLERESLRMKKDGKVISKKKHPDFLGDPISNKIITMDFAESQLELATPVFSSNKKALHWIDMTMAYIMQNNKDEVLWPMSNPPPFDKDVAIANFGNSLEGKEKHLYRRGLKNRFGLEKQLLSGYHYNFSLQTSFFEEYKKEKGSSLPIRYFASECYLHIIRNFFRFGWIIPYFYGSTPFPFASMEKDAFPYATSLRQSRFGYTNIVQQGLAPNYNILFQYVEEIRALTEAICPAYEKYGDDQISKAVLQIPNELYSFIRPKRIPPFGKSEIDALESDGVEYLEVRLLDVNPLYRTGTSIETLSFIKKILLFCLFTPSPDLSEDAFFQAQENFFQVTERGLENNFSLSINGKKKKITDWIDTILNQIDQTAPEIMSTKVKNMTGSNILSFGAKQSINFAREWRECGCSQFVKEEIERATLLSNIKRHLRESEQPFPIEPIKEMEMSTQVLIKSAIEKGIEVEILDRKDHFIQLRKGEIKETIKSATCTSKDPFVNILMKGNKSLTKRILDEHEIRTPKGVVFHSIEDALQKRASLPLKEVVIKPNSTNMGISVHFVNTSDQSSYESAVKDCFKHEDQVIVEEFMPGSEYRFLVIDFRVIAVTNRIPANVIGNNVDTIGQLIKKKNERKLEKGKIRDISDQKVLNRVLEKDELFRLREQSNVSTGGDAIDKTDDINPSYSMIAVRAAKALGSRICGVDMMIQDEKQVASQDNYSIIELNYNPMLSMHTHPDIGPSRDVTTPIFKLLGLL